MRIHHLLLALLSVFLLPGPGFAKPRDFVGCLKVGGTCLPFRCNRHMKPIGTCGLNGTKCCKKK